MNNAQRKRKEIMKFPVHSRAGIVGYVQLDAIDADIAQNRRISMTGSKHSKFPAINLDSSRQRIHKLVANRMGVVGRVTCIDGDHLNCTRDNLTQRESWQEGTQRRQSIYKGVSWYKRTGRWVAKIYDKGNHQIHCGYFHDEIEAAMVHDEMIVKHKGPDAITNLKLGLLLPEED